MENNGLKKVCIKNRTYYYLGGIIKWEDFDFDNILIDEKFLENILICNISNKTLISPKALHIRFDKTDGFMRIYDGTTQLVLLAIEKCGVIFNKIEYLISLKSGITYIFCHYFAKIKVDFYNSLPIEKILTLHNVKIIIKSGLKKGKRTLLL